MYYPVSLERRKNMDWKNIYFSHDANAMDDPKCMLLVSQMGMEGYGMFWALVEKLRQQPDYRLPLALIPALASRFGVSEAKLRTVIGNYGLFVVEDDVVFFSKSLVERMALMEDKQERRRIAGKKAIECRWQKYRELKALSNTTEIHDEYERNTNVLPSKYDSIQNINININKKENRVKEKDTQAKLAKSGRFVPPSLSEVQEYIKGKGYQVNAESFVAFYESKGWYVGKNKMKNWKQALVTWNNREKERKGGNDYGEKAGSVYDGCL